MQVQGVATQVVPRTEPRPTLLRFTRARKPLRTSANTATSFLDLIPGSAPATGRGLGRFQDAVNYFLIHLTHSALCFTFLLCNLLLDFILVRR